jgi:CRISPR-associated protein Cmr1
MNELKLSLCILTPLWTGDVDRDSSILRETSLIGSLRWWYEGLHRGLGNEVCSPVEGKGCRFDTEVYKRAKGRGIGAATEAGLEGVCMACRLFGCTGWARRFRMSATAMDPLPLFFVSNRRMANLTGNWLIRIFDGRKDTRTDHQGRRQTSFSFNNHSLWSDQLTLTFTLLHTHQPEEDKCLLAYLLYLVVTYGGLGAKVQNGFGQVKICRWEGAWPDRAVERGREITQSMSRRGSINGDGAFNLARFFSHTYELASIHPYDREAAIIGQLPPGFRYSEYFIPCAFDIRYKSSSKNPFTGKGANFGMRPFFRNRFGQGATNLLLGESRPRRDEDRAGSRINVSHLYRDEGRWRLKIWGHLPADLADKHSRRIDVSEIAQAVDDFIAGPRGMFPGSHVVRRFKRREELGL